MSVSVTHLTDLLENIFEREGVSGLLHFAGIWANRGEVISAAFAIQKAAGNAHLVVESDGKCFLIELEDGQYAVYMPLKNGWFASFSLQGNGFSVPVGANHNLTALEMLDIVNWINEGANEALAVHHTKIQDFRKFREAVRSNLEKLQRLFGAYSRV